MAKANLNSVIKYGDPCQVEYKVAPKKDDSDFTDELLVTRKVYFGPKLTKPVRPAHDRSFSVYLHNRGVDETMFMNWVYGQSPIKPYFPCVSDIYEGKIKHFVRDCTTNTIIGVFIDSLTKKLRGI